MVESYATKNPFQTRKLGEKLAKKILTKKLETKGILLPDRPKKAVIIGLVGELGSGKTTFLQGFARGLGIKEKILSPTFVLIKKFKIRDLKFKNFYHIDCYRIKRPKEILDLGFKEIISNPQNIVAIEWAEKIQKLLPKNSLLLKFDFLDQKTRKITFTKKRK